MDIQNKEQLAREKAYLHLRSDRIIEWLSTHDLISRNTLADRVGYHYQNLFQCITTYHLTGSNKRRIPKARLEAFEAVLKDYGYEPPGRRFFGLVD